MKLFGDYHTHTKYSRHKHGKGSILNNAISAKAKGLEEIAITDHGYGHLLYGAKRNKVDKMREEILEAEKITGVKILLGVEANFTSIDGTIDVTAKDYEKLDILLVGHHRFVKPSNFSDIFNLFLPNMLFKGKVSEKQKEINTKTILSALDRYKIDVLTHLNYQMPINIQPIAKKCKEKGTKIELNGKKICFTKEEIAIILDEGVDFIIDSDAHSPERVGEYNKVIKFILENNIPEDRICNLNKAPKFHKS